MTLTSEQIRDILYSPITYIDTRRNQIDPRQENYLFCSPQYVDKAFQGTIIVDSKGTTFKIKKVHLTGKLKLWLSIKHVCAIKEVLPELDGEIKTMTLDDFKTLIIETVTKAPKNYSALDTLKSISRQVNNCSSFKEVMTIFHTGLK